jgi:hypothetical protein
VVAQTIREEKVSGSGGDWVRCSVAVESGPVQKLTEFHTGGITGLDSSFSEHCVATGGEDGESVCFSTPTDTCALSNVSLARPI